LENDHLRNPPGNKENEEPELEVLHKRREPPNTGMMMEEIGHNNFKCFFKCMFRVKSNFVFLAVQ
jgi:hypothetical protein